MCKLNKAGREYLKTYKVFKHLQSDVCRPNLIRHVYNARDEFPELFEMFQDVVFQAEKDECMLDMLELMLDLREHTE